MSLSELNTSSPAEIKNKLKGYLTALVIRTLLRDPAIPRNDANELKRLGGKGSFLRRFVQKAKVTQYLDFSLADVFLPEERSGLLQTMDPNMIATILRILDDRDIWILFDDIHTVFTSDDRELTIRFIEGLIYAASDLSVRIYNRMVFVVLFLRSEIFDELTLTAEELDKELGFVWRVNWGRDELVEFLAERIKWALDVERDMEIWKCWCQIFRAETKTAIREVQDYLIERVINGPRDLLLLVENARTAAVAAGASTIDRLHIEQGEYSYGDEKLNQINRNYQHVFSNMKSVLDFLFRQENQDYTRDDLETLLNDKLLTNPQARSDFQDTRWIRTRTPFAFTQILFQVGFIGYWNPTSRRYVFSLEEARPDRAPVQRLSLIHISEPTRPY